MTTEMLLYISFVIYLMIMTFAFVFKIKWLYMLAGLMWFIPVSEIDNAFIILSSIVMVLAHFMLGITQEENSDF